VGSKSGVFVCQLEGKGGEYEAQVAAVLEVSRTKEGCPQETIGKQMLSNGLSDCRLARPGEAVQPKDRRLVEVFSPRLDLAQDGLPRAPEAAPAIAMPILSPASAAATI